jgi:hypothetical protein
LTSKYSISKSLQKNINHHHNYSAQNRIEFGNKQIYESGLESQFNAQIQSGAMMNDFGGIWALGMDLLLSAKILNKISIDFNVYRSCNCSMKAWVNITDN